MFEHESAVDRNLEELERIYFDRDFDILMTAAETIDSLFHDASHSDEECLNVVSELNMLWRKNGFFSKQIHVTGPAFVGGQYDTVSYDPLSDESKKHLKGVQVASLGFIAHVGLEMRQTEGIEAPVPVRRLMALGRVKVEDPEGEGGISEVKCAIPLEGTHIIYPYMTPSRAEAWLAVYHEEIKTDLDALLLETEDDEASVLLALKEHAIDISVLKKNQIKKLSKYLMHWLAGEVRFDDHVPYEAIVSGDVQVMNPYTLEFEKTEYSEPVVLHIEELLISPNKKEGVMEFGVSACVIVGKKEASSPVQIPLRQILAIESLRPR